MPEKKGENAEKDRKARLAGELRANLARRKAQARARRKAEQTGQSSETDPERKPG